jgi:hypothetical protein
LTGKLSGTGLRSSLFPSAQKRNQALQPANDGNESRIGGGGPHGDDVGWVNLEGYIHGGSIT